MLPTDINELAKVIHAHNVAAGWWDNPNRCVYETLQLVITEVAEATEGERKNLMDDKLPHRKMGEVELADAKIRLLDLGGKFGWVYEKTDQAFAPIHTTPTIGGRHFWLSRVVTTLGLWIYESAAHNVLFAETINMAYSTAIDLLHTVAESQGYDIDGALREKFEFNKTRPDHTREARATEHGKKF